MTRSLFPVSSTIASARARDAWRPLPVSGKSVALLVSISLHAAAGITFLHGARGTAPDSSGYAEPMEITAPDVEVAEAPPLSAEAAEPAPVSGTGARTAAVGHRAAPLASSVRDAQPALAEGASAPGTAPEVAAAPVAAAPRFAMTVGAMTRVVAEGVPASGPIGTASAPGEGAPVTESSVDTPARLLVGNSPRYTTEAESAGVEADVPLEIVVDQTGAVVGARVLAHVGYGLDEGALRGVRAYRFSPARRAGHPLAVRMRWLMRFQLR